MKKVLQKTLFRLKALLLLVVMFIVGSSAWAQEWTTVYENALNSQDLFNNLYVYDANGNSGEQGTWRYYEGQARYVYNGDLPADDYLILPEQTLEAGKSYKISFDENTPMASQWGSEQFEVVYGSASGGNPYSSIYNNTILANAVYSKGTYSTVSQEFSVSGSGNYYIAIHSTSPKDRGYIYIKNIKLEVYGETSGGEEIAMVEGPTMNFDKSKGSAEYEKNGVTVSSNDQFVKSYYGLEIYREDEYGANWTATFSSERNIAKIVLTLSRNGNEITAESGKWNASQLTWTGLEKSVTFKAAKNSVDTYIISATIWFEDDGNGSGEVTRENSVESTSVNPALGNVNELNRYITVYLDSNVDTGCTSPTEIPEGVTLRDANSKTYAINQFNYLVDINQINIELSETITTPGEYTLTIPAGVVPCVGNKANKAMTFSWKVLTPAPAFPKEGVDYKIALYNSSLYANGGYLNVVTTNANNGTIRSDEAEPLNFIWDGVEGAFTIQDKEDNYIGGAPTGNTWSCMHSVKEYWTLEEISTGVYAFKSATSSYLGFNTTSGNAFRNMSKDADNTDYLFTIEEYVAPSTEKYIYDTSVSPNNFKFSIGENEYGDSETVESDHLLTVEEINAPAQNGYKEPKVDVSYNNEGKIGSISVTYEVADAPHYFDVPAQAVWTGTNDSGAPVIRVYAASIPGIDGLKVSSKTGINLAVNGATSSASYAFYEGSTYGMFHSFYVPSASGEYTITVPAGVIEATNGALNNEFYCKYTVVAPDSYTYEFSFFGETTRDHAPTDASVKVNGVTYYNGDKITTETALQPSDITSDLEGYVVEANVMMSGDIYVYFKKAPVTFTISPAAGEYSLDNGPLGFVQFNFDTNTTEFSYDSSNMHGIELRDAEGNVLTGYVVNQAYGFNNYNMGFVNINPQITQPGTYCLYLPADAFPFVDGNKIKEQTITWNVTAATHFQIDSWYDDVVATGETGKHEWAMKTLTGFEISAPNGVVFASISEDAAISIIEYGEDYRPTYTAVDATWTIENGKVKIAFDNAYTTTGNYSFRIAEGSIVASDDRTNKEFSVSAQVEEVIEYSYVVTVEGADGAYVEIDGQHYNSGQEYTFERILTEEDVTVPSVEGFISTIQIVDPEGEAPGEINVEYTALPTIAINEKSVDEDGNYWTTFSYDKPISLAEGYTPCIVTSVENGQLAVKEFVAEDIEYTYDLDFTAGAYSGNSFTAMDGKLTVEGVNWIFNTGYGYAETMDTEDWTTITFTLADDFDGIIKSIRFATAYDTNSAWFDYTGGFMGHWSEIPVNGKAMTIGAWYDQTIKHFYLDIEEAGEAPIIPANTGILVKSKAPTNKAFYTVKNAADVNVDVAGNLLVAGCDPTAVWSDESKLFYKLSWKNSSYEDLGFYWGVEGGHSITPSKNKAYLVLDAANASNFRYLIGGEEEGTLTAIDGVVETEDVANIYDLQGKRVVAPKAGVYVKNGKKFIVK